MSPVISKIEKEFIFRFLIQNKVDIKIQLNEDHAYAYILQQNSKELKIELHSIFDSLLESKAELTVYFYFQNNYHTFNTNIIKIQGNTAIIKNPETITKNLQRKYDRININGKLNLKFSIKGELIELKFPKTTVNYYPTKPPIEADFFDVKFENILKKFKIKMNSYVSLNKIRMLRNVKPGTFEEQLVIRYGKPLYIPNIYQDIPQKNVSPNLKTILKAEWAKYDILKNKTQAFMVNKKISDHLNELEKNDVFSQVIVPVLYRDYVVGLIYLINSQQKKVPISIKIIEYTMQFARLLSYSLKENGYFEEEDKNTQRYLVPVYDLSPGGLAYLQENNFFEDKLLLNHNYNFIIDIENHSIKILAKLVRKFQKSKNYFYGFMFLNIKKEDHDFLIKYLYG